MKTNHGEVPGKKKTFVGTVDLPDKKNQELFRRVENEAAGQTRNLEG